MSKLLKTIATKDDFSGMKDNVLNSLKDIRIDMRKTRKEIIWWMFFLAVTQVIANGVILCFILKE